MNKKAIIALLSALVLTVVASVTLILTVGRKASADTEIVTVPVEYLNIQNGVLGDGHFCGAFTADGKTWIQDKLYRVEIPDTVTQIGNYAFDECSGLTSVTIPSSVTSIGAYSFSCTGLTSAEIPSTLEYIGEFAFSGCTSLSSITIPSSVTQIKREAFGGWSESQNIYCEADSRPDGWEYWYMGQWNQACYAQVTWNAKIINFNIVNDGKIKSETVKNNTIITEPNIPIKAGYELNGWYINENCLEKYDFNTPVTESMTLYAKWEAIPEPEPTEPENQEQNNETTPTEQESSETVENGNNNKTLALGIAGGSVAGLGSISAVAAAVVAKRRRK